jgi:protein-L-isoaspartate(D-aspartate) O-methyltransferase
MPRRRHSAAVWRRPARATGVACRLSAAGGLVVLMLVLLAPAACSATPRRTSVPPFVTPSPSAAVATGVDAWATVRRGMVRQQIAARGIDDASVLTAMEEVPRHLFVPRPHQSYAYEDRPLPIGHGQTISQPYVVALMTELLDLDDDDKVLEVGTGSGYQAAVLSRLAGEVYSIEIFPALAERARATLAGLGYDNVQVRVGDGYRGWPQAAPFDAVLLTAAPARIPQPLLDQLAVGGRLVAPVGDGGWQELVRVTRRADGYDEERQTLVRFVPMLGEAQRDDDGSEVVPQ